MLHTAVTAQPKSFRDMPTFKLKRNKRQLMYTLSVLKISTQEKYNKLLKSFQTLNYFDV